MKEIILQPAGKTEADFLIREKATRIAAEDSKQFIATVSSELYSLHEGNFARYNVSPGEFEKWRKVWARRNGDSYSAD